MFPMPGSDERMDEFKYLAFLSFTSKHTRKSKKIFLWAIIGIILVIVALTFWKSFFWMALSIVLIIAAAIFWEFDAANPVIITQPSGDAAYFSVKSAKDTSIMNKLTKNGEVSRFKVERTYRGDAVKISAYLPEQSDKQAVIKDIALKILEERGGSSLKPVLFETPAARAVCYGTITRKREGICNVRIIVVEIPISNSVSNSEDYYSALLTLPEGIFAKEIVEGGNGNYVRAKSLNEKNILLAANFDDKSALNKNLIYIYDLAPITIKGSGITLKYGALYSEQDLSRLLLKSDGKKVNFADYK